ncbi:hypothetical protein Fmac_015257 [Flemingia macrophylla]|uniref:Uncharacterized protein n=1 Tax=Flemingia macrophylla TaxID=520843 RepID=A0ABD1ME34_9FABA
MMWLQSTYSEARKLEGKLDALVNSVTQLAANQKPASVARVCGIRSSNDHHTSVCPSSQQSGVDEHLEAYAANTYSRPPQQVHDVAIDTSAEAIKLEGKLDALVNSVTQLAANQKPASVARVCGIRSSNDHHISVCPSSQQSGVDDPIWAFFSKRAPEGGSSPPAPIDVLQLLRGWALGQTATLRWMFSARCISVLLDSPLSLLNSEEGGLTRLSVVNRGYREYSARSDAIVIRGVHDVATDTSAEARKLEGKLDALVNLVTQLATNQKSASVARVCDICSSNDHHTSVCPSSQQSGVDQHPEAYAANIYSRPPQRERQGTYTSAEARKLEGKLNTLVNSVTQLAANQNPASVARVCGIRSSNDQHTSVYPSLQQSGVDEHPEAYAANTDNRPPQQGVHDVATDTTIEARKLDGKLDALVNSVTQLAANQKPASVARVCSIRSSNDHHTSVCPSSQQSGYSARNDVIVIRGVHDVATDTSAEARKLEGKLNALSNSVTHLAANQKPASVPRLISILRLMLQTPIADHHKERETRHLIEKKAPNSSQFCARYDVIVIRGVHDVATDTSVEARKLEGKLDALGNSVTQITANQKPASVVRVCGIRSSNDNHTSFSARNDAIILRGVHDVATDTSTEARKLEGKLDALVNSVTQLPANQKPASVARVCGIRSSNDHYTSVKSAASVLPITTTLVSVLLRSNLEWLSILRLMLQAPKADHHSSRDDELDREHGSQRLAVQKLEGKLDALVNSVTQLAANQKPTSVARVCFIRFSNNRDNAIDREDSSQLLAAHSRNDVIFIREVHDVAIDTSAEARKVEGKLYAIVNSVTLLAANQKPASVARVCGILSSNDHHTSVCPSSLQSGVDEHPEAYAANTCRVHDVATDTSTESRKLESKLDALVNSVTQLAANQKHASVARVCGIRSSNDHHTSVYPSSQQSAFSSRNDVIVIRGVYDVATDTYTEARKLEGKLDALVNLVTQLVGHQKHASVERVCGIRSSNDHHTSVYSSSQQSGFSERNDAIINRGVHDVATHTSAEVRKLEGKLDALVNLVTQLAANQKPASIARVCGIRSSNDQHTSIYPSSQQDGVDEHSEAYAANTYSIPPQRQRQDTSAKARKLEGKLDALVNSMTQLAANQKLAFVVRVCGIRSSNDHHTSTITAAETRHLIENMSPNSLQFSARNDVIAIRGVHDVATDTYAEARKLKGKLDALVNLVTQLAATQKPAPDARVCGIRSSNDHHTSFSAINDVIVIRGVHDVATDTSAEARKQEGKLDALVNSVNHLAANQKPASIARTTTTAETTHLIEKMAPISKHFSARNDAIVIRGLHDVATDTSAEARKLECKLDALVNSVTQLAANQKPAPVARVCDIRSSNDHHTSFRARNDAIVIRGVQDVAINTSVEARKLEGKLDALGNSTTTAAETRHLIEKMAPNSKQFSARNDAIVIRGVHDVATDTSAEDRK